MSNSVNIYGFGRLGRNKVDIMQSQAQNKLNPLRYYLSPEAQKRLKWMYVIKYECDLNITLAANKIGISRTWLSRIYNHWKSRQEDPRSLEPKSRAPLNTDKRKRISQETENRIVELRKRYHPWGKDKIAAILNQDPETEAGATTVNRYLHKHDLIDPKLSEKNKKAWQRKKDVAGMKFKMRPPSAIKDYKPGALMEKDMKLVLKMGVYMNPDKPRAKENFWYQHTLIDSFTRIRALGLAEDSTSRTAVAVQEQAAGRMPFRIATINNDNGGENEKDFSAYLEKENIAQFFSRSGTPTDNPRVERSHLSDELEFYAQGNLRKSFEEQAKALAGWEYVYNFIRPHQALGYLTPMAFYELWKRDPEEAYRIKDKYKAYLKRQRLRLAKSRKMKNKEQIEKLMQFIDKKLSKTNS
jgi:transposase InsO family protein